MNMTPEGMTRDQLRQAAYAVGKMLAEVGDFYDVTEELARGYAAGNEGERSLHLQMVALGELQSVSNNVLEWRVEDAREAHMSWAKIGDALDMTRQAAQQRFGPKVP